MDLRRKFANYMRRIFLAFEMVSENELKDGIQGLVDGAGLPVVSLDIAYVEKADFRLDFSRQVNEENREEGIDQRRGSQTDSLEREFRELERSGVREVALVDDVIFTGHQMRRVILKLGEFGIRVHKVMAGIGVERGLRFVADSGSPEIQCVRTYAEVVDQICERDFYPGVPYSGRTRKDLPNGDQNMGVPYFYPFGEPDAWASIPQEWCRRFSRIQLRRTIELWQEIELLSERPVGRKEVERGVRGWNLGGSFQESLAHWLWFVLHSGALHRGYYESGVITSRFLVDTHTANAGLYGNHEQYERELKRRRG